MDIDYKKYIRFIKNNVKRNYQARTIDDQLIPNVANFGGKIGQIATLERQGEYYGLGIKFLADVPPLLTDHSLCRILKMLAEENYATAMSNLRIKSLDQLLYVINHWLETATYGYDNLQLEKMGIEKKIQSKKSYPELNSWIESVRSDPLPSRIQIVQIGQNRATGNSVVPVDWIDLIFESGAHLHHEMNQLQSRIGKPPVTYAVIYSMIISEVETIVRNPFQVKYKYIYHLDLTEENILKSRLVKKPKVKYQYVRYDEVLIGFIQKDLLVKKDSENVSKFDLTVGQAVSRLQKAIRRGRYGSRALIECIDILNSSPNYNLPEQGFARVSASKQLLWRLYITILEDCRPYQKIDELGLLDLILLALICGRLLEYKLSEPILNLVKYTAILAQFNDRSSDLCPWRSNQASKNTPVNPESDLHSSLSLAISFQKMMEGDRRMLQMYYHLPLEEWKPFVRGKDFNIRNIISDKQYKHEEKIYTDVILSTYDHHCNPQIILYYQAVIPITLKTTEISSYIWNRSSSYNIRSGKNKPHPDPLLQSIQLDLSHRKTGVARNVKNIFPKQFSDTDDNTDTHSEPDENIRRKSFLILFGRKYKFSGKDCIIAGTVMSPGKIKINNQWNLFNNEEYLNAYPKTKINLESITPPFGYQWSVKEAISEIRNGKPYINSKIVPYFDGSSVLKRVSDIPVKKMSKTDRYWTGVLFTGGEIDYDILSIWRTMKSKQITDWIPKNREHFSRELIQLTFTKINNLLENTIEIGPVNRAGKRMQNSINYLYEGKLWAVFNYFSHLYSDTIQPCSSLNFRLKTNTIGYVHLIQSLQKLLTGNPIKTAIPQIKTQLWDHQLESVKKITNGFQLGQFGFGDASDVGAGKTLTALKIATIQSSFNDGYSGTLVLLPGPKLIQTWIDEIEKHTVGFDLIVQKNNGKMKKICTNTIVLTTLARIRDYPIYHNWKLVVIDECLSVQNKNALWTESAWMQAMVSKNLIMMSATFFRARFDKLYYMLKMLGTGLPEKYPYLDTILSESIVSQVSGIKRKWITETIYYNLDTKTRKIYDQIESSDLPLDKKYAKLHSVLTTVTKETKLITDNIKNLLAKIGKKRCLIYCNSKSEAEHFSTELKIPIYPSKGNHCIVTVSDGTYGLNDLTIYDTIIMKPPSPDQLPQMKGRLDRPGQKSDHLSIYYYLFKDTIDEGLLIRLDIASKFLHQYIMPLAQFYQLSIKRN